MTEPIKLTLRPVAADAVLRDPAVTGAFAPKIAALMKVKQTPPWCGFIAWSDAKPLGFAGFNGPPDAAGSVEISFVTFPKNSGKGVATAMAGALVHLARNFGARRVIAHTRREEDASTAVLVRNGFTRDGEGIGADLAPAWRWALNL